MDLENSKKIEVSVTMEQFIIRDPKESENEYRVRVWKSRELWDYVQIEWKEDDMEEEMMEKMLEMKHHVYRMDQSDIDNEIKDKIYEMGTIDRSTREHEYIWCEVYIEYLKDRKDELKMEVGMKRCRIW